MTCAPTATRTRDLLLRRQSLYPLSYRGLLETLVYRGRDAATAWRGALAAEHPRCYTLVQRVLVRHGQAGQRCGVAVA
jgi:hypothetical protein